MAKTRIRLRNGPTPFDNPDPDNGYTKPVGAGEVFYVGSEDRAEHLVKEAKLSFFAEDVDPKNGKDDRKGATTRARRSKPKATAAGEVAESGPIVPQPHVPEDEA